MTKKEIIKEFLDYIWYKHDAIIVNYYDRDGLELEESILIEAYMRWKEENK